MSEAALAYFGFENDGGDMLLPSGTADAVVRRLFPEPTKWGDDPSGWVESHGEFVISYQREILQSLLTNRYTAAVACHGPGKTRIGSRSIGWWIDTYREDAFVLWLAPKWAQVTSVMGRELRSMIRKFDLPGRLTLDQQWYINDDTLVGIGRSPADHDMHALQGYHAKKILIVVDEADGISPAMWRAIFSLMTNPDARCLMLGNPDDPTSDWREYCENGEQFNVVHIPIDRTPNMSGEKVPREVAEQMPSQEWVDEQIERYGEDSPIVQSKVYAKWPKSHERSVFQAELIKDRLTDEEPTPDARGRGSVLAVDVAREGKDHSIGLILPSCGIPYLAFDLARNDTTQLSGEVIAWYRKNPRARIVIDANGVGAGVYDNCREAGVPCTAFLGSAKARDSQAYLNARAESYFETQRALRKGALKIPHSMTKLRRQMAQALFEYASKGQLKIESKESMAERGIKSPDELDALTMAVWLRRIGRPVVAAAGLREAPVSVGGGTYAV